MTKKVQKLIENYEKSCNAIAREFSRKQGFDEDDLFWVGGEVGGIASFIEQYYFGMDDIILDLSTSQKKYFILNWQEDGTDYNIRTNKTDFINYKSYIQGLRYRDFK